MTPMDKVEVLYRDLVHGYGDAKDGEVRAASKLLMVALYNLKENAGDQWCDIVEEYLEILKNDASRFEQFMQSNRSHFDDDVMTIPIFKHRSFQA
jgi:hypothetical protein